MRKGIWKKGLIVGLILLFVGANSIITINGTTDSKVVKNGNSHIINKLKFNTFHRDLPFTSDGNVLKENDE